MELSVVIDPDLCIGSGDCVRVVPSAFRLDDVLGVSSYIGDASASPAGVVAAANGCPTQAIRVVGDGVVLHDSNSR